MKTKNIQFLVALCVAVIFSPVSYVTARAGDELEGRAIQLKEGSGRALTVLLSSGSRSSPKAAPAPVRRESSGAHARPHKKQSVVSSSKVPYHTRYVTEANPNRTGHRYSAAYIEANGPSGIYVMAVSPDTTCSSQGYRPAPQMRYVYNPPPPPNCSIR